MKRDGGKQLKMTFLTLEELMPEKHFLRDLDKKRYLAAKKDCSNCPCRQQCIGSSKNSRMVERMLHEEARQEQAKNRNTPEYFAALRLRKIWCEGNFSHQKAEHNLRRTYKRGIERVTEQCLLSACAMNLIRLVKAANAVFFRCWGVIIQGLFCLLGYLTTAPKHDIPACERR